MPTRTLAPLFAVAVLALVAAPSVARAQSVAAVHSLSDAVYLGGRLEPDGAWLVAYDLDILVTRPSDGISIGPSVSFSFGADGGTDLGRRQEWLLAADLLRARGTVFQQYGLRLMVVAGAGLWVASFYEQSTQPHSVVLMDGTIATATDHFAGKFAPGGLITVGAAADWYWDPRWALSAYAVGHIRLDAENRMPAFWVELGIGFRLGE